MTLWLANSTTQEFEFQFREPVHNMDRGVHIGSGKQVMIGAGWTLEQTASVVRQYERFGGRAAKEVSGAMGIFHGLTYRDDHPVTPSEIQLGHKAVVDTQVDRAVRETTKAALGFDRSVRRPDGNRRARAQVSEVEVKQELGPYERPTGKEVNFKMTVDPEGRSDVDLPV